MQAISARLWQSGYLPGEHAGVSFRAAGDPILFINNPPGVTPDVRRKTLDGLNKLNEHRPPTSSATPRRRPASQQYEMAFRMQTSVPELTDLAEGAGEGARACTARTCEEARHVRQHRAAWPAGWSRRGVRFVQVYHNNWDHHGNLAGRMPDQCRDVDQPC